MSKSRKILSCVTVGAIIAAMVPFTVSAEDDYGKVRVIVENHTLSVDNGADWDGVLLDEWVELDADDSGITVLTDALSCNGMTQKGADSGYITEINGLSAEDGGAMGGWMATLDDWITDEALSAITVSSGKLEDGDEICFSYSIAWGADLGYDWSGTDTSLNDISFSAGELSPEFSGDNYTYTLSLPEGTDSVTVTPKAVNKAFRIKTYKNTYTPAQAGTDYKFSKSIPVVDGDTLIIGSGNTSWMSYVPDGVTESVYQIKINKPSDAVDTDVQKTESLIEAIGEVTRDSAAAIKAAREQYNALSDEQKSKVSNYDVLTAAETAFAELPPEDDSTKFTPSMLRNLYIDSFPATTEYGSEWDVITLSRFEFNSASVKNSYMESVKSFLDKNGSEKISATRSTANSGLIAALTASGADASDFYGYNLVKPLADLDYVTQQGINGAVYALIALDTHGYEIPEAPEGTTQTTRKALIDSILSAQGTDGGWTIDPGSSVSDADMTAMALTALAPYSEDDAAVKTAAEKAILFLSENQNENGQFRSYGSYDSESCSQVIIALTAMGIDVRNDSRFIKNGKSAYDALLEYYSESDNAFSHIKGSDVNAISTYQAFSAVASMFRADNKLSSYYDMNGTEIVKYKADKQTSQTEPGTSSGQGTESSSDNTQSSTDKESSDVSGNGNEGSRTSTEAVKTGDPGKTGLITVIAVMLMLSGAAVLSVSKKKEY